jgi:membrane-associated phospholipid phosphatase
VQADVFADRTSRTSLRITAAYLALTTMSLVRWSAESGHWMPVAIHVLALTAVVALAMTRSGYTWFRDWAPLVVGPWLYVELGWLIAGAGGPHWDTLVAAWEGAVFPGDPSWTLAPRWYVTWLSETLHFCYLSYYALIFVPPAMLWLRGRRRESTATILAIVVVFTMCFTTFMFFPVDGPRFLRGPSHAPNGLIRSVVIALLEGGSSRGTAFPSAHVAVSVVATLLALRFQPAVGYVIAALTIGVAVGAVYGGYHYAVDVIAGVLFAGAAVMIAGRLEPSQTAAT